MKRTERHHLKENELANSLSAAREFMETRRSTVTGILIGIVVIVAIVIGVMIFRQRSSAEGDRLLAEAMVALNQPVVPAGAQAEGGLPAAATLGAENTFATEAAKLNVALPKLKAAADAHPDASSGITARYHMGSALAALGRYDEATAAFDDVVRRAGANSLYGRMARMGKGDTQIRAGQLDAAIATWKDLATQAADDLPVDAILMELAKAYAQKGDKEEARKAFTQIVDQHPDSPYIADARAELENLKG
jgi:tetratricopeptide (TPR) repeat protein